MKILYAVQATGNGHISRAMEIMPFLEKYGEVDIFLSGNNCSLEMDREIKFRNKGISFQYNKRGGIDYCKTLLNLSPSGVYKTAKDLPVQNYDIILNDFEHITHLACKLKGKKYLHFGHQASFNSSKTPRPSHKSIIGELILTHFAQTDFNVGLHFERYDDNIFNPIIKKSILCAEPENRGHVTVYLNQYPDSLLIEKFSVLKGVRFHIFSSNVRQIQNNGEITLFPIKKDLFEKSMISSAGIITGAGFETPSEAMFLRKKLMCIPVKGQYEQLCNAEALKKMNVPVINEVTNLFPLEVSRWLNNRPHYDFTPVFTTEQIVQKAIETGLKASYADSIQKTESEIRNIYNVEVLQSSSSGIS